MPELTAVELEIAQQTVATNSPAKIYPADISTSDAAADAIKNRAAKDKVDEDYNAKVKDALDKEKLRLREIKLDALIKRYNDYPRYKLKIKSISLLVKRLVLSETIYRKHQEALTGPAGKLLRGYFFR